MKTAIPKGSTERSIAFRYRGVDVLHDDARLVSLTDMWEAAGRPANQGPPQWVRYAGAGFVSELAENLNMGKSHVIKSRRGKGVAGTWAHWQIAMAYAKYLSHEFHRFVNEAFREWAQEAVNPDLKARRAVEGYRRRGWDNNRILARLEGIVQRRSFTDALQENGVEGPGYAFCSDAINKRILGASAREIKLRRGLPAKAPTRDALEPHELAALRFAEAMAEKTINEGCAHGNSACCGVCDRAGRVVRQAIDALASSACA